LFGSLHFNLAMQWVVDTTYPPETENPYPQLTMSEKNAALECYSQLKRGICEIATVNNKVIDTTPK